MKVRGRPYKCKECRDSGFLPYWVKGGEVNGQAYFYEFGSYCRCESGVKYHHIFPSVESIERAMA